MAAIWSALGRLKPKLRAVVVLRYFDGYSGAETAKILGWPHVRVGSRLNTALGRLRVILSECDDLRSQMACGFYCLLAVALLKGVEPAEAYQQAVETVRHYYGRTPYSAELPHFERLLSGRLGDGAETAIQSSGYVIHTLEASIWCLLNTASFQEAVLLATNLGEDTDTTASVTGGLAGIYYGEEAVPLHWRHQLARSEELGRFFEAFASACQPPSVGVD